MAERRQEGRRILLVLGTSTGGVGRHVRMLAAGFADTGHRVVVAGPRATEDAFGFTGAGAVFAEVPISERPSPAGDVRAVAALRRLARGADVVHAHGLRAGALAGLARTLPVRSTGTPLVVTLHNARTAGGAVGAVFAALERVVAATATTVLAVSPDLAARMAALGAPRVGHAVVPAPPLRPPARTPAEVRAELGLAPGRPLLLTIARLAQQKGLETLLDAAASARSGALFAIAGDGPLREPLRRRIEADKLPVALLGDRGDVPDLLAAADAVVVASRWEGQPLSVQEALRAGRPIVATDVGGLPAMVADGAGLLVPYGDAAALRDAVDRVLADPALARALSEAAARRGRNLPGERKAAASALTAYGL
ncbi:glycosyltransferase involved in cell wall biosynthesis [Thermocatellispora tengchongensis]|uniref:Glycosyltransferase involved in cell wall biosynthesis n=1 Tax=Thermocatellispora tengchongensis TaxID=1073253 RepID=A0A840PBD1_9ACTN|nr:glycosyltransferase family 4 protein [Thermocatellispora tengchongensis]MBB5135996.1 glycosyltransferase involved in cell wall biosynthesis [Thermocatellispora tengchongensis]